MCNQSIMTCIGCHNTDMVASAPEGCGLIITENVKSDTVSGDRSFRHSNDYLSLTVPFVLEKQKVREQKRLKILPIYVIMVIPAPSSSYKNISSSGSWSRNSTLTEL